MVVGAGLSGAACAWTLAQAGLSVLVLEQAEDVASGGASALPVGLMAPLPPHRQTEQARLVQQGVACTLRHCRALLRQGLDWQLCGSEQRYVKKHRRDVGSFSVWHGDAAWIKPAALVRAWLAHERITVQCSTRVQRVRRCAGGWELHCVRGVTGVADAVDAASESVQKTRVPAARVVLALGAHSPAWLAENAAGGTDRTGCAGAGDGVAYTGALLHAVGGHVLLGDWQQLAGDFPQVHGAEAVHAFNGMGHCIPAVPVGSSGGSGHCASDDAGSHFWLAGSTYEHETVSPEEAMRQNVARLAALLPECAGAVAHAHDSGGLRMWHGVRCTSSTRLPVVQEAGSGLYVLTAMGSRGLSLAAVSAEQLLRQML